jgi:hypothetical protein
MFFPARAVPARTYSFTAHFSYTPPTLKVAVDVDGTTNVIYHQSPRSAIRRYFLGITGANLKKGFPVLVNAISLRLPSRIPGMEWVGNGGARMNNSVGVLEFLMT